MKDIELAELTVLRRLTFRPALVTGSDTVLEFLPIMTIRSPFFCEFVLEMGTIPPYLRRAYWRRWREIDEFLDGQFAMHGDFRFVIRTGTLDAPSIFRGFARQGLPLLASRGCVHFETSSLIDILWH